MVEDPCRPGVEKVHAIIDAAQRRFGMYGLEKTSMREIAHDLHMSKGSLYYYFPDKEHLYRAVVEKEQCLFLQMIREKTMAIDDPGELLREYANIRLDYFRSLLNLGRLRMQAFRGMRSFMEDIWMTFKEGEKEMLTEVFQKGMEQGVFHDLDADGTATLFLDLLRGLRESVISKKDMVYIDEKEYDQLLEKTHAFVDIFIRGIGSAVLA
jgi:AcrR family transcriptional regulator